VQFKAQTLCYEEVGEDQINKVMTAASGKGGFQRIFKIEEDTTLVAEATQISQSLALRDAKLPTK